MLYIWSGARCFSESYWDRQKRLVSTALFAHFGASVRRHHGIWSRTVRQDSLQVEHPGSYNHGPWESRKTSPVRSCLIIRQLFEAKNRRSFKVRVDRADMRWTEELALAANLQFLISVIMAKRLPILRGRSRSAVWNCDILFFEKLVDLPRHICVIEIILDLISAPSFLRPTVWIMERKTSRSDVKCA